jgi:hypothetical protein
MVAKRKVHTGSTPPGSTKTAVSKSRPSTKAAASGRNVATLPTKPTALAVRAREKPTKRGGMTESHTKKPVTKQAKKTSARRHAV